jgi:hypothetical protein
VLHPEWLANPVLVLKKNKVDWRMCVDYKDLNKHCLKDPFGLPRIDQVVDSIAGCSVLSFLDCYSGYHQISLAKEDEEKTTFITLFGAFCYTSMPFGLKNAGATYQRAIQTWLVDHWGKRVEAYVDDVVIKTENSENFIEDLQLVFNSLRRYRWKLNPEKCVFRVPAGKLLGFIVSHRGIEANPEKIEAIMRMEAPRPQKKVQRLTGCMAALSRFISRLGEKGLPFYKLLKKVDKFQWTSEAQEALDALKKFLTTLHPSISLDRVEECNALSQLESDSDDWREPIIKYIKNEEEPDDKNAAERIARQSAHYTLIGETLYRRGASGVLMKCILSATGKQLLEEVHAGQCGIHAASRTLVGKVFRSGFYWPTAKSDAAELVQRCEAC